jgi:hypothetical protein
VKNSINETVAILVAALLIGIGIAVRHSFIAQWPLSGIGLAIGALLGLVVVRWANIPRQLAMHQPEEEQ